MTTPVRSAVDALPTVVDLTEAAATDVALTGSKAAALGRAASAGLPVLAGFVITTAATREELVAADVRAAWSTLSDDGRRALVVRSSSTAEDREDNSMAGRYESVVDVRGWDAFVDAVGVVVASSASAAEGSVGVTGAEPLAVLVQPMLEARSGGVLFGVDPVTGRDDRIVVSVSTAGPDAVVSGRVDGSRYVMDLDGRVTREEHAADGAKLTRRDRRALLELSRRVASEFGGPQDVEWALSKSGELLLLQSRPVTTDVVGTPTGPVFGRGPVSETFPDRLAPLEQDLWVPPLREGIAQALLLSGAINEKEAAARELVVCVDGFVALDLDASGENERRRTIGQRLDPRPRISRLMSAWRIGRLRAALPGLAKDVVAGCDDLLAAVPELHQLSERQLLAALTRSERVLVSLHAHEVLMGQLVDRGSPRLTGASVALRVLAHARAAGTPEAEIPRRHPVVLTLVPPHVTGTTELPQEVEAPPWSGDRDRNREAVVREALRLRVRWVQELMARASWELGERLAAQQKLNDPGDVRFLRLEQLRSAVFEDASLVIGQLPDERPVPVRFQLTVDGRPVAVASRSSGDGATGAGGGRGRGAVTHSLDEIKAGDVLVVETLDASLATALPKLGGLVAETGSVLAHIAILAREAGVPTVVGAVGAKERYPEGAVVSVDGTSGEVARADSR